MIVLQAVVCCSVLIPRSPRLEELKIPTIYCQPVQVRLHELNVQLCCFCPSVIVL